jgi:hypothetical protein
MSLYTYLLSSVESTINSVGINEPIPSRKLIDTIGLKLQNCVYTANMADFRNQESRFETSTMPLQILYIVTLVEAMN